MQNKDYAEIIRDAGYKMLEWDGVESLPPEVEGMQEMLQKFYASAGKSPQDPGNFTNRLKLTPDQESELADLAIKFVNDNNADIDTYLDFLDDPARQNQRNMYGIKSIEDAVKFLATANQIKSNIDVYLGLDSDQVRDLYAKGSTKFNYKAREGGEEMINDIIYRINQNTGYTGDDLYTAVNKYIKRWKGSDNVRIQRNGRR